MQDKTPTTIFVFGSNLAGRHGAGAAKTARLDYDAEYGVGEGRTGNAYAIPTKNENLAVLGLAAITASVNRFRDYALAHPELTFRVTRIGCGLAGYQPKDIAPLFANMPKNVTLPEDFENVLYDPE